MAKILKVVQENIQSIEEFIPIRESWNNFDKEYCFDLALTLSGMDFTVIKVRDGATKYQL